MATRGLTSFLPAVLATAILPGCAGNHTPVVPRIDLLGMPVVDRSPTLSHQRTVTITPETHSINVEGGDTVRFIVGARSFAWEFEVSPNVAMFDLNQVAPPGVLTHRVAVYVARNPLYGTGA